jgi:plastocyanin
VASRQKSSEFNIRIRRLAVILAGMVLAVASCGGDEEGSAATTQSPATSAATGGDGAGTVIDVDEKDFTIELSTMELTPGTYTFVATNNGQTTHALEIEGQGVEEETEDIAPGDSRAHRHTRSRRVRALLPGGQPQGHGYEAGHHSRVGPRHRSMDDQARGWALSGGALNPPVLWKPGDDPAGARPASQP